MGIEKKQLKKIKIGFIVVSILFLSSFYIIRTNKQYKILKTDGKLTVGITEGMMFGGQSSAYVEYRYCVMDKIYKCEKDYNNWHSINIEGGKFIVVYSQNDPTLNFILFENETSKDLCEIIEERSVEEVAFDYWDFFWHKGAKGTPDVGSL